MLLSTSGVRESRPENDYEVWVVRKSVIKFLEDSIGAERVQEGLCAACGHAKEFHRGADCDCEGTGEAGLCACLGWRASAVRTFSGQGEK